MSSDLSALSELVREHCRSSGYAVLSEGHTDERHVVFSLTTADQAGPVRIRFDGEVFALTMADAYSWHEFAYREQDRLDALKDLLGFLDAYADPRTTEVPARRLLGRRRRKLLVSNGAVLRRNGWNAGPSPIDGAR